MLSKDYSLLVGTYTDIDALAHQPEAATTGEGIYGMKLTAAGKLEQTGVTDALNPAVLIPHSDGKSMYAIVETIKNEGDVVRYELDSEGGLTYKDQFRASGRSTCYLALSPKRDAAIVINYWDAVIDVVDVDEDGKLGDVLQSFKQFYRPEGQWRQVTDREDHWGNRQVGPHAHCAHFWGEWVFVPDLGENAVFQYRYDADTRQLTYETHIAFEAGSGPRHMVIHPDLDICYVSNELFNTVCVARLDSSDANEIRPRLLPFEYESTVEDRDQTTYVSEIKLSPDARFLYVSNRGDDSLAIFAVDEDGTISRTGVVSTGGKFPRHFAISPCGEALVAANQDSSTLCVFDRDTETGELEKTGEEFTLPAPNYIRFV